MSECDVCVIGDACDGDGPTVSAETIRRARKMHACCECRRFIPIGDRYERMTGKWEDAFQTYATCLQCREIRRAFCCEGWTYRSLWYDIEQELFPSFNESCLTKLNTAAAKALLQERWLTWKFHDQSTHLRRR